MTTPPQSNKSAGLPPSVSSIDQAERSVAEFSGHGNAKGKAGYIHPDDQITADFLGKRQDMIAINPPAGGFDEIKVAAAWDPQQVTAPSLLKKLTGFGGDKKKSINIDLDLGILYELQDGSRGAVQAFGQLMGRFTEPPYIALSGDERTGRARGDDEYIRINGPHWPHIKRLLLYIYIYRGVPDWASARPQIQVHIQTQKPMVITPAAHHDHYPLCALAGLENIRDGIKITNYTEYFHGHNDMDRAFGFGLEWEDGSKD
jgi:tellurite resistance protein TerA